MSEQPEALRLADEMEADGICMRAAAELRRLSAENEALREANEAFGKRQEWWTERMFVLEQQRDALLEALKKIASCGLPDEAAIVEDARAAIKAVEGEKE
jgi:hypothetical protein